MERAYDGILLRASDGVFEVFRWDFESVRTPIAWLAVQADLLRHDQVRLRIGRATAVGGPLYGAGAEIGGNHQVVDIDLAEEPAFRDWITLVAQQYGRAVAPGH